MRTGITNPSRRRRQSEGGKISFTIVSSILKSSIYLLMAKFTATFMFPFSQSEHVLHFLCLSAAWPPNPSVPALLRANMGFFGLGMLRVQNMLRSFGQYFLLLRRTLHRLCSGIFRGRFAFSPDYKKKLKTLVHSYTKMSLLSQPVTQIWQGVLWHTAQVHQGKSSPSISSHFPWGEQHNEWVLFSKSKKPAAALRALKVG